MPAFEQSLLAPEPHKLVLPFCVCQASSFVNRFAQPIPAQEYLGRNYMNRVAATLRLLDGTGRVCDDAHHCTPQLLQR